MTTRELEIINRLDDITTIEWDMNMKDRWSSEDWELDHKLTAERLALGKELRKIRGEAA